jgi:ERCC4-related helicase
MKYVHPPQLILLRYAAPDDSYRAWSSPFFEAVSQVHSRALSHLGLPDPSVFREVQNQLENFHAKAVGIGNLLGTWAADCYITESVKMLVRRAGMSDSLWADPAKARLAEMLRHILQLAPAIPGSSSTVSEKVSRLLAFLKKEYHEHFSGIIFVRERSTAYVLAAVIRYHPLTQGLFQCASCVGWSKNRSRKSGICDLLGPGAEDVLQQFRQGQMNLIVATDVLEEGIDMTACHLVVCFDQSNNLKSFIQRRGRARQRQSKFVIMMADNEMPKGIERWQELEDQMVRLYRDHKRKLEEIARLENIPENVVLRMRLQNGLVISNSSKHLGVVITIHPGHC